MSAGVVILGSTGSVGVSTLDVIRRNRDRFRVDALTANNRVSELAAQCTEFRPRLAVVADEAVASDLERALRGAGVDTEVAAGASGLMAAAAWPAAEIVVAAIVGAAGLPPTLEAAKSGKRLLLANKESAVMAGPLLMRALREHSGTLIPIDSEHNAVFQCFPCPEPGETAGVSGIMLTASGGPFLDLPMADFATVTPEQACNHPNWDMGRKISVDSATMMNKGLEIIEACVLFDVPVETVQVVIHPQSIVHSLVQYRDGSVLAQLGNPDMRTPIAHALAWPDRIESGVADLDLVDIARLDFRSPDEKRFPCLDLATEAARQGGAQPIWLNAANEVAVQAFLDRQIPFPAIAGIIDAVLAKCTDSCPDSLSTILEIDGEARAKTREKLPDYAL